MLTNSIILRWVNTLAHFTQNYVNNKLHEQGLGGAQIGMIIFLLKNDGVNQDEIARFICKDKSSVGRSLKKLNELGYIDRVQSKSDRRNFHIHLTEKAHNLAPTLFKTLNEWTSIITEDITDEERELTQKILELMVSNAKNSLENCNQEKQ